MCCTPRACRSAAAPRALRLPPRGCGCVHASQGGPGSEVCNMDMAARVHALERELHVIRREAQSHLTARRVRAHVPAGTPTVPQRCSCGAPWACGHGCGWVWICASVWVALGASVTLGALLGPTSTRPLAPPPGMLVPAAAAHAHLALRPSTLAPWCYSSLRAHASAHMPRPTKSCVPSDPCPQLTSLPMIRAHVF